MPATLTTTVEAGATTGVLAYASTEYTALPHILKTADGSYVLLWRGSITSPYSLVTRLINPFAPSSTNDWYMSSDVFNTGTPVAGTSIAPQAAAGIGVSVNPNVGNATDAISVFTLGTASGSFVLNQQYLQWSSTQHVLGSKSAYTSTMAASALGSIYTTANEIDAAWIPGVSRYLVAIFNQPAGSPAGNTGQSYALLTTDRGFQGSTTPTALAMFGVTGRANGRIIMASSTGGYVVGWMQGKGIFVQPFNVTSTTTINWGGVSAEVAQSIPSTFCRVNAFLDPSGNLDIIYGVAGSPNSLVHIRRTGLNSYTGPTTIAVDPGGSTNWPSTPGLVYDANSGNLYCVYLSHANYATGEIAYVVRQGGVWQTTPVIVAPGGGSQFSPPAVFPATVNGSILEAHIGPASGGKNLYTGQYAIGAAAGTPQVLTPSGNITSSTPVISWLYSNPVTSDVQYAYRILVTNAATSATIWDTGTGGVVSPATSVPYAGPTLSANIAYAVQVSVQDSVNRTWTALSTPSVFTVIQAPTVVINSVACVGGATLNSSPATVTARYLGITFTGTTVGGHAVSGYKLDIFDFSGTVNLATSGWVALTPNIASGSSYVAPTFDIGPIPSASTVQLMVTVQDATTGATGSATWQLTTSYAIPSAPTGLTVTTDTDYGRLVLAWTNPGGFGGTNRVYLSEDAGATWTQQHPDTLCTGARLYAVRYSTSVLVAVTCVSPSGVESAQTVSSTQTLGLAGNKFGVALHSVQDPTRLYIFGGMSADDWSGATGWDLDTGQVLRYVPAGAQKSVELWPRTQQWTTGSSGRKWYVPVSDTLGSGAQTKAQVFTMLAGMAASHDTILYRDVDGLMHYVGISTFHREVADGFHGLTTFAMDERRYLVADGGTGWPLSEIAGIDY